MTPLPSKLLRLGAAAEAMLKRARETIGRCLLSKEAAAKRASKRFIALQRAKMEAERLDRLRNPRDYQGK